MICMPCERDLGKPGKHRAHRGCNPFFNDGTSIRPCWCPVCHPLPKDWAFRSMALDMLDPMPVAQPRRMVNLSEL